MRNTFLKIYVTSQMLKNRLKEEEGQDLVEYAAVILLVVLALAGGMTTLAGQINGVMSGVANKITNVLT